MAIPCTPEKHSISVLVSDADAMTARLLAADLRRQHQFHVAEVPPDVDSILHGISENSPDVLLVSTNLREGAFAGLTLLKQIRREYRNTRTIVLLDSLERQLIAELFRAGAKGVFERSEYDAKLLCRCIRSVAAGQIWANSEQIGFVLEVFAETASLHIVAADGEGLLTKREQDVVRSVAEGCSNREVAQHLILSEHTVKNYLFNIFDKLGISSRTELVMYALSNSDNKVVYRDGWREHHDAVKICSDTMSSR